MATEDADPVREQGRGDHLGLPGLEPLPVEGELHHLGVGGHL